VLRRDRAVVVAALLILAGLAWAYVVWLAQGMAMPEPHAAEMPGMDMPDMDGMDVAAPRISVWSPAELTLTFAMWAVMMVGMMAPSAAPIALLYARIARQANAQGHVFASTAWVVLGYLAAWVAFAALATAAQAALLEAAVITPMLASAGRQFGGAVLIAAGIYQWTPLKDACLTQCRSPLDFIMRRGGFRPEPHRAFIMGFRHGLYCVGCCWVLMGLLFVGGVMNLLWIAAIAVFVLLERVAPGGRIIARIGGVLLAGAGAWLLVAG
jgi:predicted metal-binding membrane protein